MQRGTFRIRGAKASTNATVLPYREWWNGQRVDWGHSTNVTVGCAAVVGELTAAVVVVVVVVEVAPSRPADWELLPLMLCGFDEVGVAMVAST